MLGWKLEEGGWRLLFGFHLNNRVKFSKVKTLLAVFSYSTTPILHLPYFIDPNSSVSCSDFSP